MMRICRYTDPQKFFDRCQAWLLRAESKNSTMLAVIQLLVSDEHAFEPPFYLATLETDAGIAGCVVRTPPDPLVLADVPLEAIPLLVDDIAALYEHLPGVTGMENEATDFARQWAQQRGGAWTVHHWRWYELDRVTLPKKPATGTLRLAESSDLDLVRAWAPGFARETSSSVDVVAFFERRVRMDSMYLWHDDKSRSLVAVSGVTPNTIRISGVYTDPEFRRQGYATSAVAAVSQRMLDAGRQSCLLFADMDDPVANRLYRNIGYRPICDKVSICLSDE